MSIDQAFLDGLVDVPATGDDGVNAPEKPEQAESVEPTKPVESNEAPAVVEKEEKKVEEDPYKILEALFDEAKPAASVKQQEKVEESLRPLAKVDEKPLEAKLDFSFLPQSDEDFDKIIASRASFSDFQQKLLNSVSAYYDAKIKEILDQLPLIQSKAVEESMKRAADFIPQHVQSQVALQEMVKQFYADNPSLTPIRKIVGQIANKVSSVHPDWSYEQIFGETAKQANKLITMFNLPQAGQEGETKANGTGKQKPAFVKVSSGARRPAKELTGIQRDIEMLIS